MKNLNLNEMESLEGGCGMTVGSAVLGGSIGTAAGLATATGVVLSGPIGWGVAFIIAAGGFLAGGAAAEMAC